MSTYKIIYKGNQHCECLLQLTLMIASNLPTLLILNWLYENTRESGEKNYLCDLLIVIANTSNVCDAKQSKPDKDL